MTLSGVNDVGAIFRQPEGLVDDCWREFKAVFPDVETLVVHPARTFDDIEMPAGGAGCDDTAVLIHILFKAALTAPAAQIFPLLFRHGRITRRFCSCWTVTG